MRQLVSQPVRTGSAHRAWVSSASAALSWTTAHWPDAVRRAYITRASQLAQMCRDDGEVRLVVERHVAGGAWCLAAVSCPATRCRSWCPRELRVAEVLRRGGTRRRSPRQARLGCASTSPSPAPATASSSSRPPASNHPSSPNCSETVTPSPTPQRAKPASATRKPWSARPAGLAGLAGLVTRSGPCGRFLGCSAFPGCRHTTPLH